MVLHYLCVTMYARAVQQAHNALGAELTVCYSVCQGSTTSPPRSWCCVNCVLQCMPGLYNKPTKIMVLC